MKVGQHLTERQAYSGTFSECGMYLPRSIVAVFRYVPWTIDVFDHSALYTSIFPAVWSFLAIHAHYAGCVVNMQHIMAAVYASCVITTDADC